MGEEELVGTFRYRARNNHAELFVGEIFAEDIHEAALKIRSKGLWVVQLVEEVPKRSWLEKIKAFLLQDVSVPGFSAALGREEEIIFLSQLSSMLQAGLPLQQALCAMEKYGSQAAYQNMKKAVEQDVARGRTLYEALGCYPEVFSETVRACIRAGEESGSLGEILQQLSVQLKRSLKAREKLKSALLYPAILMTMMMISLFIVTVFILPAFANLLGNIQGELPWATAVLLELADFLGGVRGRLAVIGTLAAGVAGMVFLYREPHCRLQLDKRILSLPAFGKVVMHAEWLQILGTLGVLLKSGIRLAEALKMVRLIPQNTYLRDCLEKFQHSVEQGRTFTEALSICQYLPWQARELLAAGDQAGRLEQMFYESAAICQEQARHESERLLVLIEPTLTLLLGLVLLFLVMAVIMPVLSIMDVYGTI